MDVAKIQRITHNIPVIFSLSIPVSLREKCTEKELNKGGVLYGEIAEKIKRQRGCKV